MVRPENEIEITERIEVSEASAIGGDALVVFSKQNFGPAQRVLDRLAQGPAESDAEKLVRAKIHETHGFVFHRVNQPDSVREIGPPGNESIVKFSQLFRGNGEIG